jgi:hypothetical protein
MIVRQPEVHGGAAQNAAGPFGKILDRQLETDKEIDRRRQERNTTQYKIITVVINRRHQENLCLAAINSPLSCTPIIRLTLHHDAQVNGLLSSTYIS